MTGYFYTITSNLGNTVSKPRVYSRKDTYYERPFMERQVYQEEQLENGNTLLTMNVVGLDLEDIEITNEQCDYDGYVSILVSGETDGWKIHYPLIMKPYKTITPTFKNGLLKLEIEWETPKYTGEIKVLK